MKNKMLSSALVLAFMALALPGNAYHIDTAVSGTTGGTDPTSWGRPVGASYPVSDPTGEVCVVLGMIRDGVVTNAGLALDALVPVPLTQAEADDLKLLVADSAQLAYDLVCLPDGTIFGFEQDDVIFGLTTCENNGVPATLTQPAVPSRRGQGGLCFMNPGFTDVAGTVDCAFVGGAVLNGNSNGKYNPYALPTLGVDACNAAATTQTIIQDVGRKWYEIQMQDVHGANPGTGADVKFSAQIGAFDCLNLPSYRLVYDEQWAYMEDGGHVTGFPQAPPNPADQAGGYSVRTASNPHGTLTPCNGVLPFYN